ASTGSARASGGIGRRAGFRFLSRQLGGGSTPPSPTSSLFMALASHFTNLVDPAWRRLEHGERAPRTLDTAHRRGNLKNRTTRRRSTTGWSRDSAGTARR